MDISQDMIIDVALNAAGYLTAALLSIVIYSIFFRRDRRQSESLAPSAPQVQTPATRDFSPVPAGSGEFIELGGANVQFDSRSESKSVVPSQEISKTGRRDRSRIVEIATKMLKAGAGVEKIKNLLPISEAELSLLKQSQKI